MSQQKRNCVFRCVVSTAHLFDFREERNEKVINRFYACFDVVCIDFV